MQGLAAAALDTKRKVGYWHVRLDSDPTTLPLLPAAAAGDFDFADFATFPTITTSGCAFALTGLTASRAAGEAAAACCRQRISSSISFLIKSNLSKP